MNLEAIFFDAGGTLVFPDPRLTLAALHARQVHPTAEQLYAAERTAKRQLDDARAHGISGVDARYWQLYYDSLLAALGLSDANLCEELARATRTGTNWRTVAPGSREVLDGLRRRCRLGLISNSDGSVRQLMEELGLADCFASITDSHHCGAEKPDARIFRAAMESLQAAPERSLYVGDIYSVDFMGARAAGMQALLMDPAGVYADTDLPRVSGLHEVTRWIAARQAT